MIIYTLISYFLCNTEKKLALDWAVTSFFLKEHTYKTTGYATCNTTLQPIFKTVHV